MEANQALESPNQNYSQEFSPLLYFDAAEVIDEILSDDSYQTICQNDQGNDAYVSRLHIFRDDLFPKSHIENFSLWTGIDVFRDISSPNTDGIIYRIRIAEELANFQRSIRLGAGTNNIELYIPDENSKNFSATQKFEPYDYNFAKAPEAELPEEIRKADAIIFAKQITNDYFNEINLTYLDMLNLVELLKEARDSTRDNQD